mmetsp:Transcript_43086/g.52266  ORF Transcript_43086/g.52266 Transcript_43086/m.52266 type:complete len:210 (-) Transcript_43086:117-746(-)
MQDLTSTSVNFVSFTILLLTSTKRSSNLIQSDTSWCRMTSLKRDVNIDMRSSLMRMIGSCSFGFTKSFGSVEHPLVMFSTCIVLSGFFFFVGDSPVISIQLSFAGFGSRFRLRVLLFLFPGFFFTVDGFNLFVTLSFCFGLLDCISFGCVITMVVGIAVGPINGGGSNSDSVFCSCLGFSLVFMSFSFFVLFTGCSSIVGLLFMLREST